MASIAKDQMTSLISAGNRGSLKYGKAPGVVASVGCDILIGLGIERRATGYKPFLLML